MYDWADEFLEDLKAMCEYIAMRIKGAEFRKRYEQLEEDVEDILTLAQGRRDDFVGAINWAGLHCAEAGYVVTKGRRYWRVVIEEAAPEGNADLCAFIYDYLMAAGWPADLEVSCEW